jgi:protein ImuB
MFACIHSPSPDLAINLPSIAEAFTPWFEQTAPDTIVFPVDGLKRLYGAPHEIAQAIAQHSNGRANIAIAKTAEAAILAARNFPGVTIHPDLDHLDISTLPLPHDLPNDLPEILETWGIHTLDQLAALPETGLAERFGPQGVYLQRLAKGAIHRPLRVFQPPTIYQDRIALDHPVELLEPLLFLIARILNQQCEKLQSNGLAAIEITIRLELENKTEHLRTLRLPVPMRDSKALLKLLQMDLEAHPPSAPTMALSLHLKPAQPRTVQSGIFMPPTPAPDKLELTLARIRGIVGENNAGIPELLDTHHPHPFHLVPQQPQIADHLPPTANRQAFRYFRPPTPARVELQNQRPSRVSGLSINGTGIHEKVLNSAGPWRNTGGWWTPNAWNRDEWDVTLTDHALYRIYREPDNRWFIEGAYD